MNEKTRTDCRVRADQNQISVLEAGYFAFPEAINLLALPACPN